MTKDIASSEWLRQEIFASVCEVSGTSEQSAQIADRIATSLQRRLGGQEVYVPSVAKLRRQSVLAEYDGRNVGELSLRHHLSRSAVYRIVKPAHRAAK
jgi:Mor family transcriptional regulator